MDFGQFFSESWKWLFITLTGILAWLHLGQGKRIDDLDDGKVDKPFYKKDQELLKSQLENKIDRVEFHLRLLCEKNGIHYQEKR